MSKEFKENLQLLAPFLLPTSGLQPKIVAGTNIMAKNVADYLGCYVKLLNTTPTLSAQSILQVLIWNEQLVVQFCKKKKISQATAEVHNMALIRKIVSENKKLVSGFETRDTFQSTENLLIKHRELKSKALQDFNQQKLRGHDDSDKKILAQLENVGLLFDHIDRFITFHLYSRSWILININFFFLLIRTWRRISLIGWKEMKPKRFY